MTSAKEKIKKTVSRYKLLYADEYEAFRLQNMAKRENLYDQKFGQFREKIDAADRVLHEVPVNLDDMIQVDLSQEEWDWYKTKDGARWFAKMYKDFRHPDKV